jgi:integrase
MKLTAKRIARLLKAPGRYPDGDNLYFRVSSPGNASWLLRYARDGRERMLGLGPLHTVTLAEARIRAKAARQQLLDGVDPIDQKRAQKAERALEAAKAITFSEAAQSYYDQHEKKWKNPRHRDQWISTLQTYCFPRIGNLPVSAIDTGLVLKCIEPHWQDKTETMSRVRGRIESVLDWCKVRGYRTGDNPAKWKGHLKEVLPARDQIAKPNHHPALPFGEIGGFLTKLRTRDAVAAKALEFLILTAARTGEVIGAKWGEIDFAKKEWTIPEGRMKGGRQHRVPLSNRVIEILSEVPREEDNPHVFIGPRTGSGLSSMAMTAVLKRMGHGDITVHGFRSTFKDWADECTNTPIHVTQMALAHAIGDKTEAAYRRGDLAKKRKVLMDTWAAFCAKVPSSNDDDVVVLMRRRARR